MQLHRGKKNKFLNKGGKKSQQQTKMCVEKQKQKTWKSFVNNF